MKQPIIGELVLNMELTKRIRAKMAKVQKAKITINIDTDSLAALREKSGATGVPYQRLLNQILKEALQGKQKTESRLDHLERELDKAQKKTGRLIA